MSKSRCLVSLSSAALMVSGVLLMAPRQGMAQIEEIVVTTRKKAESLQDVPIAVDAFSADTLQRQGINNLAGLVQLSPSVQFDQSFGPQDIRIAIRGLSNTRGRSNVAFLVDGVDVTTENFISAGSGLLANQRLLADVERVEIVKGPQSALFGRAAFAGAISYTTKEPGDEFEGSVRVEAGQYGLYQIDGAIGGPVAGFEDVLGVRVNGAYWSNDGFYTNSVSAETLSDEEGFGLAGAFVFTPTDATKIKLRTEYTDSKFGQRAAVRVGGGFAARAQNPRRATPLTLSNPAMPDPGNPYVESKGDAKQTFFAYPTNAITPDPNNFNQTPLGAGSLSLTGLTNFGQYCPPSIQASLAAAGNTMPGYCLPTSFGSTSDFPPPAFSENPVTGRDYQGTETQLFRVSLNASIDYDFGTFVSITGWNDYKAFDELDQDYQAVGRPDTLLQAQQGQTSLSTNQFSQEFRFQSTLDSPVNFTLGGLYWTEDRRQDDLNNITSCAEYGKSSVATGSQVWPSGLAYAVNGAGQGVCSGPGRISTWQEEALAIFPCEYDANGNPIPEDPNDPNSLCRQTNRTPQPWRADTDHWSFYFSVDWDLTDNWTVQFENRTIWEQFTLLRPNKSGCSQIAFPFGQDVDTAFWPKELPVSDPAFVDIVCQSEQQMNPNIPVTTDVNGNWFLIEGTQSSFYNTPKVTVNWEPTDDALVYFSWGVGQKPGGINQLSSGGFPTTIEAEKFDAEIVDAWEIGAKTTWEVAGFLQANTSFFLNDYTDKQVGTQIVTENGFSQPRVINAAAAQVWGLELELTWQPEWVEGLTLFGSYTWLDPTYVDFQDTTRSLQRSAVAGSCDLVYRVPNTEIEVPAGTDPDATPFCKLDLSGNQLERVPENAFVGQVNYTAPFLDTGFDWFTDFTATFEDRRFANADNQIAFDDYWLLDLRGGLNSDNWEILAYVKNLLDDDTIKTGGSGPDFGAQVGQLGGTSGFGTTQWFGVLPQVRQFGVQASYRF